MKDILACHDYRFIVWGLFGAVALHGLVICGVRLRFTPRDAPLSPRMFFLGAIIGPSGTAGISSGNIGEEGQVDLLHVINPRLILRGIAPRKPGLTGPLPSEKTRLKDNLLPPADDARITGSIPFGEKTPAEFTAPVEPYRRLRLQVP
jgi:hypothetical protein